MKIGILTLLPAENYGGILQAVALYSYLSEKGHDVTLIRKQYAVPLWRKCVVELVRFLPLKGNKFSIIKNRYVKACKLKPFIEKYMPAQSRSIVTAAELEILLEEERFDAVIVGSDQVWRYSYINDGHYSVYFLDVNVCYPLKKIAYAASFGLDHWEAKDKIDKVSSFLKDFTAISVREKSGAEICLKDFGVQSECVVDPTLLVGVDFYNRFFDGRMKVASRKTLVTYILDESENKNNFINKVMGDLFNGDDFVQVNLAKGYEGSYYLVEEWVWEIKNAGCVITDSFHGMIFSILFEKEFFVSGNVERGLDRFLSVLIPLGLEDRIFMGEGDDFHYPASQIDYASIKELIGHQRRRSVMFIENAISVDC